jgi:(4S)-4-hydroxy-5-phosphonooxypentane-2,3-dione isomerase
LPRFERLLGHVLDSMRAEANFRNAVLHRNPDDPYDFLLYESWADHEDVLNVQMKREYRKEWQAALPQLLVRPREITIWKAVRGDGTI